MGKDKHEYRRMNDKPDPNPAVSRPTGWVPGGTSRVQRIIEWRKKRARSMYRYQQHYLKGD